MNRSGALAVFGACASVLGLAGCVSAPEDAPAWFAARAGADLKGYPSLHDVPRTTIANTDAVYWSAAAAELALVGQAVKAHPRAQAGQSEDPLVFLEEARAALDAARASHE